MKRVRVLCCCGAGMGTCMLVRNKVEKVLKKIGLTDYKIENQSVQQALFMVKQFDMVVCNHNLANKFDKAKEAGLVVVSLDNVTDENEIETKIIASGILEKINF